MPFLPVTGTKIRIAFSRPSTPNDNPFIESLYSTVKAAPAYPGWFSSSSMHDVQVYFEKYFRWYNHEHFHSGLNYLHSIDKHEGRAEEVLKHRKECSTRQRELRNLYCSGNNQIIRSGL